jgi:hypothetical protein
MKPGSYKATWNGRYENGGEAPFGSYFIFFKNGKVEEVRQVMLIK